MNAREILDHLDAVMKGSMLDNLNYDLIDARLTVFRSDELWSILLEYAQTHVDYTWYDTELFAYGNCLREEGFLSDQSRSLFESATDAPFYVDDDWAVDASAFSVMLRGRRLSFTPTPQDYAAAGIELEDGDGPGSLSLPDLGRFLAHHLNHPFFAHEDFLRYVIDGDRSDDLDFAPSHYLALFFQTNAWQHPDFAGGQLPSGTPYFRLLAEAIETGDASLLRRADPKSFNTHWRSVELMKTS